MQPNQEKHIQHLLIWLWNHSESAIGIKSSWETLTSGNKHNGKLFQDPYQDHTLSAISTKRQLEQALLHLPLFQQHILFANYGPVIKFPLPIQHVFSKEFRVDLTPTVLSISTDYSILLQICQRKMQRKETLSDKIYLKQRLQQATLRYTEALEAIYPLLRKIHLP